VVGSRLWTDATSYRDRAVTFKRHMTPLLLCLLLQARATGSDARAEPPLDSDGDGIPDHLEDVNQDGIRNPR